LSNDALNWAWKAKVGAAKLVLVALADQGQSHSGEDWTCFPSVNKLIEMADAGRSTVERHLRWLDAEGWITRRRRVRKDGRLGIFDYTLHQDPEVRARLKAERAAATEAEQPALNMSGGDEDRPALNMSETSAHFDAQPALKSSALEPLVDPLVNPKTSGRAREPGDEGFEEAWAAWPELGRTRSSPPNARAAWSRVCLEHEPVDLMRAIRRYAFEDRDGRRGMVRSMEGWLSGEYFRHWLEGAPPVPPPASVTKADTWADGLPPEVASKLLAKLGAARASDLLRGAAWRDEDRTVLTARVIAAKLLRDDVGYGLMRELNIRFEPAHVGPAGGNP
jgi:DNA-binding MarR family transcriptional regulator